MITVQAMFYDRIRLLDSTRDQDLCLMPPSDYSFVSATNAIPLVAEELFAAQGALSHRVRRHRKPLPVAVVGLRTTENLFIDTDGGWRAECYLPLYIRRHPFILMDRHDGRLHLAIDAASPRWSTEAGQKLFEAGEPTALTRGMLDFCTKFRRQHETATALGAALREHAVLVEYRFNVTAAGRAHSVTGCHVVSEEKLAELPDDVFLTWRRAGWLPLITAHLLSLRQWEALGRLAVMRPASLAA